MDVRGLSYFHIFLLGTHLLEERGKIFSYLEIQCNTLTYKIIAFCVKVNTALYSKAKYSYYIPL